MGFGYFIMYRNANDKLDIEAYIAELKSLGVLCIADSAPGTQGEILKFDINNRKFVNKTFNLLSKELESSRSVCFYAYYGDTNITISLRYSKDNVLVEAYNLDVLNHPQKQKFIALLTQRFVCVSRKDGIMFTASSSSDIDENDWDKILLDSEFDVEEEPDIFGFKKGLEHEFSEILNGFTSSRIGNAIIFKYK